MDDPGKKTIFVVEDNELHAMYLDYYLGKDNEISVILFESGEECIEKLHLNPDVIVLDYYLKGKNGLEILKEIRLLRPEIPVAVVSGQPDEAIASDLLAHGAFKYVRKNHGSMQELIQSIDDLINDRN